jgi:hypothetical protein
MPAGLYDGDAEQRNRTAPAKGHHHYRAVCVLRISFYSGRHFWKTMMNAEGLGGDAEEVFMGHKVSADVSRRYNHRDKQGETLVVKTAGRIFSILDRVLFSPPGGKGNILVFPGNNSVEDAPAMPAQETDIARVQ